MIGEDLPSHEPHQRASIFISAREWTVLQDLRYFALGSDERCAESHFLLECQREDRVWSGGNGRLDLAYRTTGPAPVTPTGIDSLRVPIHSRFFPWDEPKDLTLKLDVGDGRREQTMTGLGFNLTLPEPPRRDPAWRVDARSVTGQRLSVERESLERAAAHASSVPLGASNEAETAAYLRIRDGYLEFSAPWPDYGSTITTIPLADDATDTRPALIHPRWLAVLAHRTSDETVTLRVPSHDGRISMVTSEFEAIFTPIDRFADNRRSLEQLLCDLLGVDELTVDEDGDYPVATPGGQQVWVRLTTSWTPLTVQVFGVLADEIQQTDDVMKEVNLINTSTGYVRSMWREGQVIVAVDLLEQELNRGSFKNSLEVIAETVDRYQPLFSSFFANSEEPPHLPGFE